MATPVDSSRAVQALSTAGTSHTVNTGSPAAGVLMIILIRFNGAPGTVTFTGYTQLASDTTDASDDQTMVFYKQATGSEGSTATVTTVNAVKSSNICWLITGAEDPSVSAPTVSTVAIGTTTANTANPGSVAPAGAPRDTLYIAMMGGDGAPAPTAAPTNYSNLATSSSTGGSAATRGSVGGASRSAAASSSDDPGVFTHPAANSGWAAYTVAIRGSSVKVKSGYGKENG